MDSQPWFTDQPILCLHWLKAEPFVVRTHDMSQREKVRCVFGFGSCPMFPFMLHVRFPTCSNLVQKFRIRWSFAMDLHGELSP